MGKPDLQFPLGPNYAEGRLALCQGRCTLEHWFRQPAEMPPLQCGSGWSGK